MPTGTADGGKVHLGAAAHALVLRSSPWHTCGPSGIILGGPWVLGLLLSWLGLQGTGHLEGPCMGQADTGEHARCQQRPGLVGGAFICQSWT